MINKRCIVNDIIYVTKLTVFNNTTLNFITKYVYAFHKCFNQCLPFHVPNSGRLLIKRLSERMFYNFQSSESILGSLQFGALYTSLKFTITLDMTSSLSNSVMKLSFYVGWLWEWTVVRVSLGSRWQDSEVRVVLIRARGWQRERLLGRPTQPHFRNAISRALSNARFLPHPASS